MERLPELLKERAVLEIIREIEVPFTLALREAYGEERGWRICAPAAIALSIILSSRTGIPLKRVNSNEAHIEVCMGIYDPKEKPDRLAKLEEQTYIRYYTGDGYCYYIDPIYGLLMEGRAVQQGAIQVEKYLAEEIDDALIASHNLYPFDPAHEGLELSDNSFAEFQTPEERQTFYDDVIAAMNDHRATMPAFVGDSLQNKFRTDWRRVIEVIKRFAPQWQEDWHQQEPDMLLALMLIFGENHRRAPIASKINEKLTSKLAYLVNKKIINPVEQKPFGEW